MASTRTLRRFFEEDARRATLLSLIFGEFPDPKASLRSATLLSALPIARPALCDRAIAHLRECATPLSRADRLRLRFAQLV